MTDRRRVAAGFGIAAVVAALGAIVLATVLATPETFTWRGRALSDMGRHGAETFWLFNGGLVLGGVLGLPFAALLWATRRNALERLGAVAFTAALAGLALVGVFFLEHTAWYLETELHAPAALLVFGSAPVAHWLLGLGAVRAGDRRWGWLTVGFGVTHVLVWGGWIAYATAVATQPRAWFAVPEFLAAAVLGCWTILQARRLAEPGKNRPQGR